MESGCEAREAVGAGPRVGGAGGLACGGLVLLAGSEGVLGGLEVREARRGPGELRRSCGASGSTGAFGEKGSESSFLSERAREASEGGAMRPRVHPPGSLQTPWDARFPGLMQCACLC